MGKTPFGGSEEIKDFTKTEDISDLSIADLAKWMNHLEKWDIYFSAPLDLDMLLFTKFKCAYTDHLDNGQRGPSGSGDPRDAVLGDADVRPDVDHWKADDRIENLRWYRYLFLTHSKPSTHLGALSHVAPADLAALEGRVSRLLDRIKKAVTVT